MVIVFVFIFENVHQSAKQNLIFLLTNIYLSSISSKEVQVRTLTMRFIKV